MKHNVLTWVPIFVFILFVLIVKRYFYNFHNSYVDILEKAFAVLLVLAYGYKSITMGIISVMIMLVFYTVSVEKLEGFSIGVQYRDRDIECMTNTQWLVKIYNDAAHKSWS